MDRAPRRGLAARGALTVLLAALLLGAGAGGASAVVVHLPGGPTLSYQPQRGGGAAPEALTLERAFSNVEYNGGPVMPSNTNYALYWEPSGSPAYPSDYQPGIDRFFEDLAHDSGGSANVDSVAAQYNDAAGQFAAYESHFGGALIDTDPYPANGCKAAPICLTDAQLRAELTKFVAAHGLPSDLAHEYFLLTPPGVEDCFQASGLECSAGASRGVYCAYHGNIPLSSGEIIYANDPYVTGNEGCDDGNHPNGSSDGALEGGLSHEHNESITDPEPNNAWADWTEGGSEIGDKCRTFVEESEFGTPLGTASNGAKYNQLINGHSYWYQQEWSNQTHQCLQRLTFSGEEPAATFTSTPVSGNEVSFDAGGSSAPGGVAHYDWQWNDGPGPTAPTETTSATVVHRFGAAGIYTVALTVFASDGTSLGTAQTITVGKLPAPTVAKLAPVRGPGAGGTAVKITGLHLAGASEVRFGSTKASFTLTSGTTIEATAPVHAAGAVDVTVTTPGGTSAITASDRYTYTPAVTALSPSKGPASGGTIVTVTGSGFALGSATTFKFGATKATLASCSSSTRCTVTAPKHAPAAVEVIATAGGVSSHKSAPGDRFSYS